MATPFAGSVQVIGASGPVGFARIDTFVSGSLTPQAAYTTAALSIPHSNPIICDALGRATVWLNPALTYRIRYRDAAGIAIPYADFDVVKGDNIGASAGAGLVGFLYNVIYAAGTVGKWLQDLATAAGSAFIGFAQAGVGAVTRTVQSKLRENVSVKDFGAVGDGIAIDTSAILAAVAAAKLSGAGLVFPSGTYKFASPIIIDWSFARVTFLGKVRLVYTGASSYAICIDGGVTGPNAAVHGVVFGMGNPPVIEAIGTTWAVYSRSNHRGHLEFDVAGCLTAGLKVAFAVCMTFRVRVSGNLVPFVQVPTFGMLLDQRDAGEYVSACTFDMPIIEAVLSHGIVSTACQHCTFINGTSEGNGGGGYIESGNSQRNMLVNMDNEANVGADFSLGGFGTTLFGVLGTFYGTAGAAATIDGPRNTIQGGSIRKLTINPTAVGTVLRDFFISNTVSGGGFTDNGVSTVYDNVRLLSNFQNMDIPDRDRSPKRKRIGPMTVFSAANENPCRITIADNGLDPGDSVVFAGVGGMTQLNGNTYQVEPIPNSNSFYLMSAGAYVNSTAFGVFTTGGTATQTAFTGTWVNTGGGLREAGFTKDAAGLVHMVGNVQSGTTGTAVLTLPVGHRPLATVAFSCLNTQVPELAVVTITSAGVVTATFATPALAKISLDNISFRADL